MSPKAAVPPPDETPGAPSDPTPDAPSGPTPDAPSGPTPDRRSVARTADSPDLRIAVSPAQAAVGFGIIASLILLVLRRRRRG